MLGKTLGSILNASIVTMAIVDSNRGLMHIQSVAANRSGKFRFIMGRTIQHNIDSPKLVV